MKSRKYFRHGRFNVVSNSAARTKGRHPALRAAIEALEPRQLLSNSIIVTNLNDSGSGSLRAAITTENAGGGGTITFASGLTAGGAATVALSSIGDGTFGPTALAISSNITIDGGAGGITLTQDIGNSSPTGGMRLFYVSSAGDLTLDDVTLSGGLAQGGNGFCYSAGAAGLGGAIVNAGTLNIVDSTLSDNTAQGGDGRGRVLAVIGGGGGLGSSGSSNNAGGPNAGGGFGGGGSIDGGNGGFGGGGGAGFNGTGGAGGFGGGGGGAYGSSGGSAGFAGGNGSADGSTGGGGAGLGGAIFNYGGTLSITNSTLVGNTAVGGAGGNNGSSLGGAIFNLNGTVNSTNSTLANNVAAQGGGAIYNLGDNGVATQSGPTLTTASGGAPASVTLNNTILAGSNDGAQSPSLVSDYVQNSVSSGFIASGGGNNIIQTAAVSGSFYGIATTADPLLGALGNYGGPTQTDPLLAGSPAIGAGVTADYPGTTTTISTDQRGYPRPASFPDLGAYQYAGSYTITVNDTSDVLDNPTNSLASNLGATVSLRDAINAADNTGGAATIVLPSAATFDFTTADNDWYGPDALPPIDSNVTIQGNGSILQRDSSLAQTTADEFRFFYVSGGLELPAGTLALENLTLTNGLAKGGDSNNGGGGLGAGGAIFNQGTLALNGVTLANNTAIGGSVTGEGEGGGGAGMGEDAPARSDGGGGFGPDFTAPAGTSTGGTGVDTDGGGGGGGFIASGANANGNNGGNGGGSSGLGGAGGSDAPSTGGLGGDGGGGGSTGGNGGAGGGSFGEGGPSGTGEDLGGGGGGVGGGGGEGGGGGFGGGGGGAASAGPGYELNAGIGGFGAGGGGNGFDFASPGQGGFGGGAGAALGGGGAGLGGAIFSMYGSVTIVNSTLSSNTAQGGHAILAGYSGTGGSAHGGAIFNLDGAVSLTFTTVAANFLAGGAGDAGNGSDSGGALYNLAYGNNYANGNAVSSSVTLEDSILYGAIGGTHDLVTQEVDGTNVNNTGNTATVTDAGNNIVGASLNVGQGAKGTSSLPTTFLTANPLLAPLANYGGSTQTMALLPGSPAIDAGTTGDLLILTGSGNFAVTVNNEITASLASNVSILQLQSAIDGLSSVGAVGGSATVDATGNGFTISFAGISPPALDATALSGNLGVTVVTTDQRGVLRPQSSAADIGAFESSGFTIAPVSSDTPQGTFIGTTFSNALGVTVTANNAVEPVAGGIITYEVPSSEPTATLSSETATIGVDGSASVTATAGSTVGNYDVTASASGIASPASFSLTNLTGTSIQLGAPTVTYDATGVVTVTLLTNSGTATGNVSLSVNSGTAISQALVNGSTTFDLAGLDAGSYSLRADYAAQGLYASSFATGSLQVNKTNAGFSFTGASGPFTGSAYAATGTATGVESPTPADLTTLLHLSYENVANSSVSATAPTAQGTYEVLAKFDGNTNYNADLTFDTGTKVVILTPAPMFTVASTATIVYQTASFTFSGKLAAGALYPTGSVSITLHGVTQSATIQANGTFSSSFKTSALAVGAYPVSYSYGGGGGFASATGASTLDVEYGVKLLFNNTTGHRTGTTISVQIEIVNAAGQPVLFSRPNTVIITATGIANINTPTTILPVPNSTAAKNVFLTTRDPSQFTFGLNTKGLAPGTYLLYFTISGDPVTHSVSLVVTT